ncbi:Pyridoxal phosphate-dependent transferase major region subdomain 2 [Penicillium capsulatum]|uniref:Pyridoxal phosphate-dependent transferase major region subdomain 2 n=1 Tax=Penicillium capsulatum TaxID=69766 RepID=A0A9W9IJP7_9EURO|nr:Pyridoxal phosphate-dependent transferase major region subdomain 2 [Penicillium capsulatum]KAJ6122771.1 Pyridoxal phosphate-dependent transferase major region subdomain 2 [Penicillium capsulatum]
MDPRVPLPDARPDALVAAMTSALAHREARSARRRLTVLSPTAVDFSSNDFLSLSTSPAYRTRFLKHLNSTPESFPFASGGSRLLDGNSTYAEELERFVAGFHDAPTALLFNSGFDANIGVLSCIPQPGDLILYDELIHASSHEGMKLSRAGSRQGFAHSSPAGLREVLQAQIDRDPKVEKGTLNVFIVVESIYSMDGDVAPIKEFIDVVDELLPAGNGYFIVDEAHATGVFGPRGAGVVQQLGVQDRIFIRVHTFGKALASHGAMVLGGPEARDYLINYARSLIYTTALGFPFLAGIRTAYELLSSGETEPVGSLNTLSNPCRRGSRMAPQLQHRVQKLIRHLRRRLDGLSRHQSVLFEVDHFPTSPIISLRTSQPRELASACQRDGYIVRAIMPPTIPEGKERVRVCLHAGNSEEQIDGLVQTIQFWLDRRMAKL